MTNIKIINIYIIKFASLSKVGLYTGDGGSDEPAYLTW